MKQISLELMFITEGWELARRMERLRKEQNSGQQFTLHLTHLVHLAHLRVLCKSCTSPSVSPPS